MASQQAKLHRSKSTSSVKERRKHPLPTTHQDADTSRVHALIAAHRAMDRSQTRSSTALYRTDSSASRRSNDTTQKLQFSPATQLRRQRSVLQSKAPHLAAALQLPQDTRVWLGSTETDASEFGTLSETYGAEPSSYRRLRRTKSLMARSGLRQSGSAKDIYTGGTSDGLGLRIRKSFNFLRPTSRVEVARRAETSLGSHDGTVLLERGQYLDRMPQSVPERKPSLLLETFRRPHKTFRKSVRSGTATDSPEIILPHPKRSFSGSLRHRLLKVFSTKSVVSKSSLMPPQQLEATRRHFSAEAEEHSLSFDDYQIGDEDDERRQSFYVPSKAADVGEEFDQFPSQIDRSNSRESLHSNGRSRVTSWTNSTSTVTSSARPGALQHNRLSIIKEDGGPHQPSCSAGRHIGGISGFQDPLPEEHDIGGPVPAVDSQRLYDALMKRIDAEEAEQERTRAALEQIHQSKGFEYSTIRAVSNTTQGDSSTVIVSGEDETEDLPPRHAFLSDESSSYGGDVPLAHEMNEPEPVKPVCSEDSEPEWRGWIEGQVNSLTRANSHGSKHVREHAQINPEDVELDFDRTYRPPTRAGPIKRFPAPDLRELPTRSTGLRKISPSYIARMIRERKSQMLLLSKDDDSGKENRPSEGLGDSPPVSTPGRFGLQMRGGNGRLRKRASEMAFSSQKTQGDSTKTTTTPGRKRNLIIDDESPTERIKVSLSARLSRPFNMDVPESNRPFDSVYLGKGELGTSNSGTRLSVAAYGSQRGPGGYGGLGRNPFDHNQDTALPDMALSQHAINTTNIRKGFSGIWNSKRIVSDFLKKRRTRMSNSDEHSSDASPAFV